LVAAKRRCITEILHSREVREPGSMASALLKKVAGRIRMKTTANLLALASLLLAANAYAGPSNDQPRVPHAHYGRDGFWHCDDGYITGESGACEPVDYRRTSAYTRLREFEDTESVTGVAARDER
jgi:hypothetical protein